MKIHKIKRGLDRGGTIKAVELTITMEAFGHEHKKTIVEALKAGGYAPRVMNPTGIY